MRGREIHEVDFIRTYHPQPVPAGEKISSRTFANELNTIYTNSSSSATLTPLVYALSSYTNVILIVLITYVRLTTAPFDGCLPQWP